jgi:hypothetical protein
MKRKTARDSARQHAAPLAPGLPVDEHNEELLDEALTETFPASDPIAVPLPEASNNKKPATPSKNR